jgi:uncharacterized protein YggE
MAGGQAVVPQPPRLVTSGEGETRVTPDRATVFVGVQTRALTASAAGAENARRQKAILDTLKAMGIPPDQLATQNYSVSPEMRYDPTGVASPKVVGYVVSNTVRVELKKMDQVGSVIDAALAKGANQIGGVQFGVSTVADARRIAISAAVRDARADAEAMAAAAGGSVGQLLELSSSTPPYRPRMSDIAMKVEGMARAQTPIEPGEQVITATVSAVWQFIPGSGR